jgi:myo-inositol-1(or 4)-monophosphatase
MTVADFRSETHSAVRALRAALPIVRARRGAEEVRAKAPGDIVTGTDLLVQSTIQQLLYEEQPEIVFVGEEGAQAAGADTARRVWFVDPVCGTSNYAAGLPLFAINIALAEDGRLTAAAIADGTTGDLYVAEKGRGAWRLGDDDDPRQLHVSPSSGMISLDPHGRGDDLESFGREFAIRALRETNWDIRMLATTLALPYVADGRLAAAVYAPLGSLVHFAAGLLLVQEAGAVVTDHTGVAWDLDKPVCIIAASRELHADLLALARDVLR